MSDHGSIADTVSFRRFDHIPRMSACTMRLIDVLKKGEPGDLLTDEQLSGACGRQTAVGGDGYNNLQTAIRYCKREHGLNWARQVGAGAVKCLNGKEGVVAGRYELGVVRRRSKRAVQTLQNATTLDDLDDQERSRCNALMSQHATLAIMAQSETTKKLAARNAANPVDPKRLLQAMIDNVGR